jgi:hypothetical protein
MLDSEGNLCIRGNHEQNGEVTLFTSWTLAKAAAIMKPGTPLSRIDPLKSTVVSIDPETLEQYPVQNLNQSRIKNLSINYSHNTLKIPKGHWHLKTDLTRELQHEALSDPDTRIRDYARLLLNIQNHAPAHRQRILHTYMTVEKYEKGTLPLDLRKSIDETPPFQLDNNIYSLTISSDENLLFLKNGMPVSKETFMKALQDADIPMHGNIAASVNITEKQGNYIREASLYTTAQCAHTRTSAFYPRENIAGKPVEITLKFYKNKKADNPQELAMQSLNPEWEFIGSLTKTIPPQKNREVVDSLVRQHTEDYSTLITKQVLNPHRHTTITLSPENPQVPHPHLSINFKSDGNKIIIHDRKLKDAVTTAAKSLRTAKTPDQKLEIIRNTAAKYNTPSELLAQTLSYKYHTEHPSAPAYVTRANEAILTLAKIKAGAKPKPEYLSKSGKITLPSVLRFQTNEILRQKTPDAPLAKTLVAILNTVNHPANQKTPPPQEQKKQNNETLEFLQDQGQEQEEQELSMTGTGPAL